MREKDLKWYQEKRAQLAKEYEGQWIVVFNQAVVRAFTSEVDAIEFAFGELANDEASVLEAVAEDPFIYVG